MNDLNFYLTAKKNGWLYTDEEAKELLKDPHWNMWADYGKDEKFLYHTPYVPVFVTPVTHKEKN